MDGDSKRESAKSDSIGADVPVFIHLFVWMFMIALSLSPTLCLLSIHDGIDRSNGLASLAMIGLIQVTLWVAQRRCSSEELSYWDGLLIMAASVTTGENLASLFRAFWLLLAIVVISVLFALDHDPTCARRHAGLRFGKMIVWLYKQRPRISDYR